MKDLIIYDCADFFMVRYAHLPIQTKNQIIEDKDNITNIINYCINNSLYQEAIAIASPSLYQSLKGVQTASENEKKKIVYSLLKYLSRMYSKSLPFGLFASVGWGNFAGETQLHFYPESLRKKIRPNQEWLSTYLKQYLTEQTFVRHLDVVANPQIIKKEGRVILIEGGVAGGKKKINSIRETAASAYILSLAKRTIKYKNLEQQVFETFQNIDRFTITEYIWNLFQNEYLISNLSPSFKHIFSLSDVIQILKLIEDEAHLPKPLISNIQFLDSLCADFKNYEKLPIGKGVESLDKIYSKASIWQQTESPLHVDTYHDHSTLLLNKKIQQTIQKAGSIIWRFAAQEPNLEKFSKLHLSFLEKFGTNRLIPLLELLQEAFVQEFFSDISEKKSFNISDYFISSHFQPSEIDLEEILQKLPPISSEELAKAPLSMELFFEIASGSLNEIDQGNFRLIVRGLSIQLGATFGRFLYLWDPSKIEMMRNLIQKEESLNPDLAFVGATFLSSDLKTRNISFAENLHSFFLSVNSIDDSNPSLELEDLFIGADENHLYAFSKRLNKELLVTMNSAVNPAFAPTPLKLLLAVSRHRFISLRTPWDRINFGPYTPRVKYQNIILSPAKWHFNYEALCLKDTASEEIVKTKLGGIFQTYHIPDWIYLVESDSRLLLNWKNSYQLEIIAKELIKNKSILLYENSIEANEYIVKHPEGNIVAEFVVPMIKNSLYCSEHIKNYPPTEQVDINARIFCPGSEWLYMKVFLSEEQAESFLTAIFFHGMNQLLSQHQTNKFFYVWYKEDRLHLRIRIHGSPHTLNNEVLSDLHLWMNSLIKKKNIDDWSLCSYEREIERYGGPESIEIAENFFYSDSLYCSQLLTHSSQFENKFPLYILACFGIINILKHFYEDVSAMMDVLSSSKNDKALLAGFRPYSRAAISDSQILFFDASKEKESSDSKLLKKFLAIISETLTQFALVVNTLEKEQKLWNTKTHLVNSLIHMHCNRLMGLSESLEAKARVICLHILSKVSFSLI